MAGAGRASLTAHAPQPVQNVRLHVDDRRAPYQTTFVFIGNNEYVMEGFNIGQRARLDGERLSVYVSHRRGRGGLLTLALRALFGRCTRQATSGADRSNSRGGDATRAAARRHRRRESHHHGKLH